VKLFFLRHGEADWPHWNKSDDERPLTDYGKEEMQKVAALLERLAVSPGMILKSPLPRAAIRISAADPLNLTSIVLPGPRVPAIVISPWAKPGFVDHTTLEFSSVLKLIEDLHGLKPLTQRDGEAADLLEAFDFTQRPNPPLVLSERDCAPARRG